MPSEGTYPNFPRRPNFTDIRTMQIFDPIVMGSNPSVDSAWEALSATGATLENGVRLKQATDETMYVTTTSAGTGGTADYGFILTDSEEVFVEVRQLSDVWVCADSTSVATFIAS